MYIRNADYNREVFVNYQLNYLVETALFSLNHILNDNSNDLGFDNKIHYYRFFVDHLLMCLGQINDYLVPKRQTNDAISLNRNLYGFTESEFPIISNKNPRNLVEHLGERNNITINNNSGVGGFNVLFPDSDTELVESINNNPELYPYTLDKESNRILFSDNRGRVKGGVENYSVNLISLNNELSELKKRIIYLSERHKTV